MTRQRAITRHIAFLPRRAAVFDRLALAATSTIRRTLRDRLQDSVLRHAICDPVKCPPRLTETIPIRITTTSTTPTPALQCMMCSGIETMQQYTTKNPPATLCMALRRRRDMSPCQRSKLLRQTTTYQAALILPTNTSLVKQHLERLRSMVNARRRFAL